uniref:G-protein coupled receptors family 1 profile domain-containing protein n=1 Tax=Panagrolaimus sp. JU765 TaxID=591449 RepID=A0AC34PUQ2_9BILA
MSSDIFNSTFNYLSNISAEDVNIESLLLEEEENTRRSVKLFFCIVYSILFVLGTIGNGIVIVMICNVMLSINRNHNNRRRKVTPSSTKHVFIYVLGLSIVDLLVILHLPLLIFEMIEGQWIFGTFMCKLYWYGESVNKLLSSFLMTVLSWDRYLAVCSPINSMRVRRNSVAIGVLFSCSFLATLMLYPVLKESMVLRVNKLTGMRLFEATEELVESDKHGLTISKCIFDTSSPVFMLYTFIVGYLIPAMLISYFYLQVILTLRRNAINVRKQCNSSALAQGRLQKVTQRIVAVVLFYFFCWSPYWMLNILSQFNLIIVSWSTLTLSSIFFGAHILVCFNSAANPVLYALINRELRQQHVRAMVKRRQSLHTATHNAMEFIEKHSQRTTADNRVSVGSLDSQLQQFFNTNSIPLVNMKLAVLNIPEEKRSFSFSNGASDVKLDETLVVSDHEKQTKDEFFL